MAGLQRSTTSFRRQGSSGLVWDDKVLSGDLTNFRHKEADGRGDHRPSQAAMMQRSRSESGGRRMYRTDKEPPPVFDPPSPKVSGCGLCGLLGKPAAASSAHRPRSNKRNY